MFSIYIYIYIYIYTYIYKQCFIYIYIYIYMKGVLRQIVFHLNRFGSINQILVVLEFFLFSFKNLCFLLH